MDANEARDGVEQSKTGGAGHPLRALVLAMRHLRRRSGMTAQEVSLAMGRSPSYVSTLECERLRVAPRYGRVGHDGPSLRVLMDIARGHGVTFGEFAALVDRFHETAEPGDRS